MCHSDPKNRRMQKQFFRQCFGAFFAFQFRSNRLVPGVGCTCIFLDVALSVPTSHVGMSTNFHVGVVGQGSDRLLGLALEIVSEPSYIGRDIRNGLSCIGFRLLSGAGCGQVWESQGL